MMDHNTRAHNVIYEWARLTITSEGWWCRDCGEAFFEAPETSRVFEALQEVKRRVEAAHVRSAQAAPIVEGGAADEDADLPRMRRGGKLRHPHPNNHPQAGALGGCA